MAPMNTVKRGLRMAMTAAVSVHVAVGIENQSAGQSVQCMHQHTSTPTAIALTDEERLVANLRRQDDEEGLQVCVCVGRGGAWCVGTLWTFAPPLLCPRAHLYEARQAFWERAPHLLC